jgi:replicative DNA helicase
MGKTTLALQVAAAATTDVPVVIVTFEHAPANLTLKLLCARAGVNLRDVQRGYADLAKLRVAAKCSVSEMMTRLTCCAFACLLTRQLS